jgi:formylglycine-generating enzyme required for sulfatase activity
MYCNWLSDQEKLPRCYELSPHPKESHKYQVRLVPDSHGYRLPTEAEWEYACRARTTTRFCTGDNEEFLNDFACHAPNSNSTIAEVGSYMCNAWGLFDMHGNVDEWCSPGKGILSSSPVKGNSFQAFGIYLDSSARTEFVAEYQNEDIGFRVMLPVPSD